MSKKALGCYRKVKVTTSSPIERVVMVYSGINKKLNAAIQAYEEKSPSKFELINNSIQSAEKLIHELQMALDKNTDGEIANRLDSLYTFWINHLSKANREKSVQKLIEVQKMVNELYNSWSEIERQFRNGEIDNNEE